MSEKIATREAYGQALADLGDKYDLVVMDADLSKSTKTHTFQQKFPDRFFNAGIAEGNMVSTAAGIASCGKTVFVSSFAMFAAGRAFEQIRNSVCYPNLNVKIGASHAGITVGEDGASHQCIEDIAIMRSIPNMVVINPADAVEAYAAVEAAIQHNGPVYLRLGRLNVPVVYDKATYQFELGKGITIKEGNDVTIIATGLMVKEAIDAAQELENEGISARVIDIHTIKPIDRDIVVKAAKETGVIVTAEEGTVCGGLGSAVCEVVAAEAPCKVGMVGVQDVFGRSGTPAELVKLYGLTKDDIIKKVKELR